MAFFTLKSTDAEKAQKRMQKELKRVAKQQQAFAAQERKAQQAHAKIASKEAKRQEKRAQEQQKAAQKSHQEAVRVAKKASKTRIHMAHKADKQRARQQRRAKRAAAKMCAGGFAKSASCSVCAKKFGKALHRRRHHCRECRESCCLQCTSRTRRPVPKFGHKKPQKVCVVCDALVFNNKQAAAVPSQPREPAEAVEALAASGRARRPHSAPLPPTEGVTISMPATTRGRAGARSTRSKGGSIWTLPIRPLLKRKKSAEQMRNRKLDMDLQLEKQALFGGRGIDLQPQMAARAP